MLPDGRVVTGGGGGRVLVWDPAEPGTGPVELGRHGGRGVWAVAVLPDGRVVTGASDDGRVLVWDPAEPGTGPVELGRHGGAASAVAVLPDGRVIAGDGARVVTGGDGAPTAAVWSGEHVLVWDPAEPGTGPVQLGRHSGWASAVAVLPDGRVVTGGGGRVLVWDPAEPGTGSVELGRHGGRGVWAVAVLPDGRVVTGGDDDRVRLWDVQSSSPGSRLACSADALATSLSTSGARLFIGHAGGGGISCWEVRPATQNTPGAGQHAG